MGQNQIEWKKADIVREIKSMRAGSRKAYQLKDGTRLAVLSSEPLHTRNGRTGRWEESQGGLSAGSRGLTAKMGAWRVTLPDGKNNLGKMDIENGRSGVEWEYLGTAPAGPEKTFPSPAIEDGEPDPAYLKKSPSKKYGKRARVRYAPVGEGVGFVYEVKNGALRKSIVLCGENPGRTLCFRLRTRGLTPVMSEDGRAVDFCAGGKRRLRFSAPFMRDAAGERSEAVFYRLNETGSGSYDLCIEADAAWLHAPERIRPVTIDLRAEPGGFEKTLLCCKNTAGGFDGIAAGFRGELAWGSHLFADLSWIPASAKIHSAVLTLTQQFSAEDADFYWRLNTGWQSIIEFPKENGHVFCLDVTESVKSAHDGGERGCGFALFPKAYAITQNGSICGGPADLCGPSGEKERGGVEFSGMAELWVQYAERDAYSGHPSLFAVSSAGEPENGHIDLFTGALVYEREDVRSGSAMLPFSVSHYWIGSGETYGGRYGKGWGLSLDQRVEMRRDAAGDAAFIDEKGRIHSFIRKRGSWKDTGGLGLTLARKAEGYVIHDGHGGRKRLDSSGWLRELEDASGNRITVERDPHGRISAAKDSFGRRIGFYYDGFGRLDMIADPAGRMVTYCYDAAGCLAEVKYPDGSTVSYAYDEKYRLAAVKKQDGAGTVYRYSEDGRVIRAEMYAPEAIAGTAAPNAYREIVYRSARSVAVADQTGMQRVYVLDKAGRTVLCYEDTPAEADRGLLRGRFETVASLYRYTDEKCTFAASFSAAGKEQNRIANGSFEMGEDSWRLTGERIGSGGPDGDGIVYCDPNRRAAVYQLVGSVYGDKYLEQTVSASHMTHACGGALMLSAWAKADSAPTGGTGSTRFEIRVRARYTDGASAELRAGYDAGYAGWQYMALPIPISYGKTLLSVTVYLDYSHNRGRCLFGDVRLWDVPSQISLDEQAVGENTMVLGKVHRIVRRAVLSGSKGTVIREQDSLGDIVRETVIDCEGNKFVRSYAYDKRHRLILRQDERDRRTEYTYHEKGMPASVRTYFPQMRDPDDKASAAPLFSEARILTDETGEFAAEIFGAGREGLRLRNRCHPVKGLLRDMTLPSGQTIRFAYDAASDLAASMRASVGNDNYFVLYEYTGAMLSKITRGGFSYGFAYDNAGRMESVSVAGETYWKVRRLRRETETEVTSFAGGEKMEVESDCRGRPVRRTYTDRDGNDTVIAEWEYDANGRTGKVHDHSCQRAHAYRYDKFGSPVEETIDGVRFKTWEYDRQNRMKKTDICLGDRVLRYLPIYEARPDGAVYPDAAVTGIVLDGVFRQERRLDRAGRVTETVLTLPGTSSPLLAQRYGYSDTQTACGTSLSRTVRQLTRYAGGKEKDVLRYTYDGSGNITAVRNGTEYAAKYTYDGLDQLIREDNAVLGQSRTFAYDTAGNLLAKKTFAYTTGPLGAALDTKVYSYASCGWRDRLTGFGGDVISYDALGNPTVYRGHALIWGRVRLLLGYRLDEDSLLTFAYDADGIRVKKGETVYVNDGERLLREIGPAGTLTYYYGSDGICGFRYDGVDYFYEKNLQGDVTAIYDEYGGLAAAYAYDAWGAYKILVDAHGIGTLNPFRYRGYYYDTETGLYYLSSRYYDPETGRFLNADMTLDPRSFSGYNAFAYCLNCPVRYRMPSGRSAVSALGDDTGRWTSFYRQMLRNGGALAGLRPLLDETRLRAPVHC